jgi:ABC-type transport system involved in Fe-S cluster assembly fused permease/ATPase subunit
VKLDRERLWTILHPGQLLIAAAVGFVVLIPVNAVVELSNGVGVSGTVVSVEFAVVAIVVIAIYQWRMLRDDRRSAEIEELRARADSSADREA